MKFMGFSIMIIVVTEILKSFKGNWNISLLEVLIYFLLICLEFLISMIFFNKKEEGLK